MNKMARKQTTHSPTTLTVCSADEIDDVYLKRQFNTLPKSELMERIARIQDPILRERAEKIARAAYIT